jgi:hypothetical protein
MVRLTGCRIDIPAFRRRGHKHGPRDGTGLAQRQPCTADCVGVAGRLHAQQGVDVVLFIGRRVFEPHLIQSDLQFFGHQHRDRGVGALAHFDIRHGVLSSRPATISSRR